MAERRGQVFIHAWIWSATIKKFFIGLTLTVVLLAATLIIAISFFSQKAPEFLKKGIERSFGKRVKIESIQYHFPAVFEIEGFELQENGGPFDGETSFYVDHINLVASVLSLSQKALIIERIEVEDADVVVRKRQEKFYQPFSNTLSRQNLDVKRTGVGSAPERVPGLIPLEIRFLSLRSSNFKFIDYDVREGGFVTTLNNINAKISKLSFPITAAKTYYTVEGSLFQGRDQKPAQVKVSGWTCFGTWDTEALFGLTSVHLPYFAPYYGQVLRALIEEGYVNSKASVRIENKTLVSNIDFELDQLLFQTYESGDQLFDLKAEEILSFLKDSSNRLKLQITLQWDMSDRSVKLKQVIRRSIEKSLKKIVLGNVGNIIANTIQKIGDGSIVQTKDGIEGKIRKIKDFLKY